MTEPLTRAPSISGEPSGNKGLDYAFLREEGIRIIQELASSVWTDYNEHDPGVTTVEQVAYALTELSYRAQLPMEDLLGDPKNGRIDPYRQALFIARRIFPCNPVTADDYRKLLVDRVAEVANAWLETRPPGDGPRDVWGLYDIWLYVPGDVCDDRPGEEVVRQARRVYLRHRNLCEDLGAIHMLKGVTASVEADVSLGSEADPSATMARLLFNLGLMLAPELRRRPLESLVRRRVPSGRIFEGPLLLNGFIDDDQLQPLPREFRVEDIAATIAGTRRVAGVSGVAVELGGGSKRFVGDQKVPVPAGSILELESYNRLGDSPYPIRLFQDGLEVEPEARKVRRELERLQSLQRRSYELREHYEEFFGFPRGQGRDLRQYYSVQNQYPEVYGISEFGLPDNAPTARQALTKQFKGYLMVFDQLMADYFAQLARARDLFSIDRGLRRTYFFSYLYDSVPDVEPLLSDGDPGYRHGLPALVRSQDPFPERRNRFLDVLLALYGERLTEDQVAPGARGDGSGQPTPERMIQAKLDLLHRLVVSTRTRGAAFDTDIPPSRRNIAGLEIKSRIQLGLGPNPRAAWKAALEIWQERRGQSTSALAELGAEEARLVDQRFPRIDLESRLASEVGLEPAEAALPELDLRIGSLGGGTESALAGRLAAGPWLLLGSFFDEHEAERAARVLIRLVHDLDRRSGRLFVVEHILLRYGERDPESRGVVFDNDDDTLYPDDRHHHHHHHHHRPFVYDFTVTAVISGGEEAWPERRFQRFARQVVGANLPAHIVADYCFLGRRRMRRFEALYRAWRRALLDRRNLYESSCRVRLFLEECQRHVEDECLE